MLQFKSVFTICLLSIALLSTTGCSKKGCTNSLADNYDEKAKECDNTCTYTIKYEVTGSVPVEITYNWNAVDDRVTICTTAPWSKTLVVDMQSCYSYNIWLQVSPGNFKCNNPITFQGDLDFSVTVNDVLCQSAHITNGTTGFPVARCE